MRELTKEELEMAPDFATHYVVTDDGDVVFKAKGLSFSLRDKTTGMNSCCIPYGAKPIPRKSFDISEYRFSDKDVAGASLIGLGKMEIHIDDGSFIELSKQDAIAIAKALGVTGEDL